MPEYHLHKHNPPVFDLSENYVPVRHQDNLIPQIRNKATEPVLHPIPCFFVGTASKRGSEPGGPCRDKPYRASRTNGLDVSVCSKRSWAIGHKSGTPCHGHIVPRDGKMVKYGDESQSCPQKSSRVPRNMIQCMRTIVREGGGGKAWTKQVDRG